PGSGAPPPYSKVNNEPGSQTQGGGGWRPGFWTGLGVGGLAGHLAGRSGRRRGGGWDNDRPYDPGYSYGSTGSSPSSWGWRRVDNDHHGHHHGGGLFGDSGGGPSRSVDQEGTRSSTGFGGTRNR
ncbi:hypothetical protein IE53DRAFT_368038, partial [Violaceomyces palustris]